MTEMIATDIPNRKFDARGDPASEDVVCKDQPSNCVNSKTHLRCAKTGTHFNLEGVLTYLEN